MSPWSDSKCQRIVKQNNVAEMHQKPVSIETSIRNWSILCCFEYNDGAGAIINVMKRLSVEPGMFFHQGAIGKNDKRIKASTVKSSETGKKKRRKQLRATAKGYKVKEYEEEGETYKSGAF